MSLQTEIKQMITAFGAEVSEKNGKFTIEKVLAERKVLFSKKKLVYKAKYRIDEDKKELHFTECLKETGFGFPSDSGEFSAGVGFKTETYKTKMGPREGMIKEQSELLGKKYNYEFDYSALRKQFEAAAERHGYKFEYHITGLNL